MSINNQIQQYLDELKDRPKTDSSHLELTIFSIATALKAKTIIELGVRQGGTTLPLLMAAHQNNGLLYSVDIGYIEVDLPDELKPYWRPLPRTDALNFLDEWNKDVVADLILIDDWHSYEHVKKELSFIDMMVSPKSVVLVHDLMYGNWEPHYHCDIAVRNGQWADGGPYRAVAELDPNFWEFSTIPVNNGLTILRKKYSNKYHKI